MSRWLIIFCLTQVFPSLSANNLSDCGWLNAKHWSNVFLKDGFPKLSYFKNLIFCKLGVTMLQCVGAILFLLSTLSVNSQTSYFNQQLLRQTSAERDRLYLGIPDYLPGANVTFVTNQSLTNFDITIAATGGGGGGSGTVTNFSSGNANPLFTTTVGNPTDNPSLGFTLNYTPATNSYAGIVSALGYIPQLGSVTLTNLSLLANSAGVLTNDGSGNLAWVAVGGGGGGGMASAIDYALTNLLSYDASTNFAVDFAWTASVLIATGDIAFRYSTNWPTGETSRFSRIFIPASNSLRRIYIFDASTNWLSTGLAANTTYLAANQSALLTAHVFRQGETNVTLTYQSTKSVVSSGGGAAFDPTAIAGCVLWLEASTGLFQNTNGTTPVTLNGDPVRRWNDSSGMGNHVTNTTSTATWTQFGAPNSLPCVNFPGISVSGLRSMTAVTYAQPTTVFVVWNRATSTLAGNVIDGTGANTLNVQLTSSSNLTVSAGTTLTGAALFNGLSFFQETVLFSGTGSNIRTNGVSAITGNAGVASAAGFTVGQFASSITPRNIAEILVYNATLSTTDRDAIENYFLQKFSLP